MSIDIAERARRWFTDMWGQRDRRLLVEWMHEDVVGWSAGQRVVGRDAWVSGVFEPFTSAFADMRLEVIGTVTEGDQAVIRWRFTGTHSGDALGVQACGLRLQLDGITWFRFRDGRIVEGQDAFDASGLMLTLNSRQAHGAITIL